MLQNFQIHNPNFSTSDFDFCLSLHSKLRSYIIYIWIALISNPVLTENVEYAGFEV